MESTVQDSSNNISDFEFDVVPESNGDVSTVLQRLKEFTYYLVENFELNLNFCLKLLEEKEVPTKANTIHTTVLSKLLYAIPKIGTGFGNALARGELFIIQKIDKKNSRILADLVYYYSDHKEDFRKLLIESAVDVFCSFEDQFQKLTCNGGQKRAMQKLAIDASDRIFNYFLETEQKRDVTKSEVTKGIIFGESKRNRAGKKEGKTVTNDEKKWKTCKLYRKVGIVFPEDNIFYKNKSTHTEKYGHRRLFPWEAKEDIISNWEEDIKSEIPQYVLTVTKETIKILRDFVMTKNPNEEAKLERENYNKQAVEDRQEKYEGILRTFCENFHELLDELEKQYSQIVNSHKENANLLEDISLKQDAEIESQVEIKIKLQEIHTDIIDTKEGQAVLIERSETMEKDIVVLKNNQEEMANAVATVNIDQVKDVVEACAKENFKSNLTDAIRETLRKNDPGPRIRKEFERTMKKFRF